MSFLSRRRNEPRTASGRERRPWLKNSKPYSVEKRPTFLEWLKITVLDIITMIVLGAIALGVFRAGPAGTRLFPLTVKDNGEVVYPQFAYPYRDQYIAAWLATFLAIVVPIVFILLFQLRIRSFWDINNGIIGLIYAVETSSAFQVMLKWLVGGLRPNFYDVCKPDPSLATQGQYNVTGLNGLGYQNYMFTKEICTTDAEGVNNSLESFPSGHSTTIFAGMIYLYLYFNGKLKVFSNYHPAMWKLILLYCPVLGACLVGGSLTVDESHNWYDVIAGATIGTVFAFSAYRMVYAAVWDWRINHIPLNRGSALNLTDGVPEGSGMVFTKRAGWRASSSKRTSKRTSVGGNGHSRGVSNGRSPRRPEGIARVPVPRRSEDIV